MQKLVTVVIPLYKVELYATKCLKSVVNQTYQNLEIILVPQPGGDECEKICREFEKKDERVKVIPQTYCDLSHARNVGIDNARGEYISFIDSDDIVDSVFIETMVRLLEQKNADIVQVASYAFIDEKAIVYKKDALYVNEHSGKELCKLLTQSIYGSDAGVIQTKLYRRGLFEKIRFPEGRLNEDGATNYKLYWNAKKIVVSGQKLYYYRSQRVDSIIHAVSDRLCRDTLISSRERVKFYKELGEMYLYEYALYTLGNGLTRARACIKGDALYLQALKKEHNEIYQKISLTKNVGKKKKMLSMLGYYMPNVWMQIWTARKFIRHIIEWKIKGVRK